MGVKIIVGSGLVEQRKDIVMLKERNFKNFLEAYGDYCSNHEGSERIHLWTCISMLAGALERKVWLDFYHYVLFPNMYVFLVGPPGLVKKSTSSAIGMGFLRKLEGVKFLSERGTAASLIDQLSESHSEFMVEGARIRQCATFCYASELNVFLKEVYGSIVELLTTFYDCQPYDSKDPWVHETKTGGRVSIYGPCLNLLGCSTPAWLSESIPVSQLTGGFASRVIYVVDTTGGTKLVSWPKAMPGQDVIKQKLLEDLQTINQLTGEFRPEPEVYQWVEDFHTKQHKFMQAQSFNPRFAGYFARKENHIHKVAMVLSAAQRNDLVLTAEHYEMAKKLLENIEGNMLDAFETTGKNELASLIRGVLKVVQTKELVSEAELLRIFLVDADHKILSNAIDTLLRLQAISMKVSGAEAHYLVTERGKSMKLNSLRQ